MIKGDVQMAGFRTFIKNAADSLNVKGFADNLEDGSVKVVCEGKEEGIKEFVYLFRFFKFTSVDKKLILNSPAS
jgi:acylphosphatase